LADLLAGPRALGDKKRPLSGLTCAANLFTLSGDIVNKLPVSVCIIAGAEAHRIARCLASVAPWTSEIVVVINPEVQDATDKIAAEYGAKIQRHPFEGFREQKNFVLTQANQPWVLSLDADEEVSTELRESIENFFAGDDKRFAAAQFARKVWFLGRWITHGDWYPDRVLRLFRRDAGKWAGSAEHCVVETLGAVTTLGGDLLHYSNPDISSYVNKINYFADVYLRRQLEQKARWSAPDAVARAAWRFVRAYFVRLGFLDGYPGFFIAASTAYATLVRHSRLFEHLQPRQPVCAPAKSP
jgi:glycosyltransferase involved in cell wall biosynthesis